VERVRGQLEQERQLRAVTEACLMEDRIAWQRVTAAASDTLRHCARLQEGLSLIRYLLCSGQCDNYNLKSHRRCNNMSLMNFSGYV